MGMAFRLIRREGALLQEPLVEPQPRYHHMVFASLLSAGQAEVVAEEPACMMCSLSRDILAHADVRTDLSMAKLRTMAQL